MLYNYIGQEKIKTSIIGIGGLHFGVYLNKLQTKRILDKALDSGINFIDSAPIYGNENSQKLIGEIIKDKRKDLILGTKIGLQKIINKNGNFGVKVIKMTRKRIIENLDKSLKDLKTEYIDLFQLHAFDKSSNLEKILLTLEKLKKDGKIREIGFSNFNSRELNNSVSIAKELNLKIATLQVHHNLIERRAEKKIIPICKKNNIKPIFYRVLARGILSDKYLKKGYYPPQSRALDSERIKNTLTNQNIDILKDLKKVASKYEKTVGDLAIAWQINNKLDKLLLLGVRDINQLNSNISATKWVFNREVNNSLNNIFKKYAIIKNRPRVFFEK